MTAEFIGYRNKTNQSCLNTKTNIWNLKSPLLRNTCTYFILPSAIISEWDQMELRPSSLFNLCHRVSGLRTPND